MNTLLTSKEKGHAKHLSLEQTCDKTCDKKRWKAWGGGTTCGKCAHGAKVALMMTWAIGQSRKIKLKEKICIFS